MVEVTKPSVEQKWTEPGEKDKLREKDEKVGKDKRIEKDEEDEVNKKVSEKYLPSHKRKDKWSDKYKKWLGIWAWIPNKRNEHP